MIKNNLKTLISYISGSVLAYIIFIAFNHLANTLAANVPISISNMLNIVGAILGFITAIAIFFYRGKRLAYHDSKLKNLLSVVGVSGILFMAWLITFIITYGRSVGTALEWIPYLIATAYGTILLLGFENGSVWLLLLFALLPCLTAWCGLEYWNRHEKVQ